MIGICNGANRENVEGSPLNNSTTGLSKSVVVSVVAVGSFTKIHTRHLYFRALISAFRSERSAPAKYMKKEIDRRTSTLIS